MQMRNLLFEASPIDPSTGLPVTVRMSFQGVDASGVELDGLRWIPAIVEKPVQNVTVFGSGQVQPFNITHGEVKFAVEAALGNQHWSNLVWDGALGRVWVGTVGDAFASYTKVFEGALGAHSREAQVITVPLFGSEAGLATREFLSATYAGTGNGEGNPSLKGKLKPRAYGACSNIAPVLVDPAYWIFQFHDGAAQDVTAVYEMALSLGAPVATQPTTYAALRALELQPGEWAKAPALGMFRFGGQPTGKVTADVMGARIGGTFAGTLATILPVILQAGGVSPALIDQPSFNAFPYAWSLYLTEQATVLDIVRDAMMQVQGYAFANSVGVWQAGTWFSGKTPVTIREDRSSLPLVVPSTLALGQPAPPFWRVKVGYDRCWSVHSDGEISSALRDVQDELAATAEELQANRDAAQLAHADAMLALQRFSDMAADNILDRAEKAAVIQKWQEVTAEKAGINSKAANLSITAENNAYNAAYSTLAAYINSLSPALTDTSANTSIVRNDYNAVWVAFFVARQNLLNRIGGSAEWSLVVGGNKPDDGATRNRPIGDFLEPHNASDGDYWLDTSGPVPVYKVMVNGVWQVAGTVGGVIGEGGNIVHPDGSPFVPGDIELPEIEAAIEQIRTDLAADLADLASDVSGARGEIAAAKVELQNAIAAGDNDVEQQIATSNQTLRVEIDSAGRSFNRNQFTSDASFTDGAAIPASLFNETSRVITLDHTVSVALWFREKIQWTPTTRLKVSAKVQWYAGHPNVPAAALYYFGYNAAGTRIADGVLPNSNHALVANQDRIIEGELELSNAQVATVRLAVLTQRNPTSLGDIVAGGTRVKSFTWNDISEARKAFNDAAALVSTEEAVRVSQNSAIVNRVTNIEANYITSGTAASIADVKVNAETIARVNQNNALIGRIENTEAQFAGTAGSALKTLIDGNRKNLSLNDWWKAGAAIPWSLNGGQDNGIYPFPQFWSGVAGPSGETGDFWVARADAGGQAAGGWQNGQMVPLDPDKTYRFIVPIVTLGSGNRTSYWGTGGICDLNTTSINGNPYFAIASNLTPGKWHLFVGYIFPRNSTNKSNDGAGVWDTETGLKVIGGTNYCFHPDGRQPIHRAYQFYAANGAYQAFGRPLVEVVDGSESNFMAAMNAAMSATTANARITSEETVRANAVSSLVNRANTLESQMALGTDSNLFARIRTEETTRSNQVESLSNRAATLESKFTLGTDSELYARLRTEETTRANQHNALSTRTTTLESKLTLGTDSELYARIRSEETTRANQDSSLSTRIDSVVSRAGALESSVSTHSSAISTLNGRAAAYWQTTAVAGNNRAQITVRADANGGAGVDIVGDVNFAGNLNVGPDSGGNRVKMTNSGMTVFDQNGTMRVRLGLW